MKAAFIGRDPIVFREMSEADVIDADKVPGTFSVEVEAGKWLRFIASAVILATTSLLAQQQQTPTPQLGGPQIRADETFRVLHFTVRGNYVIPQSVEVEEGWYRITVGDPSRVAPNATISLDDEGGIALAAKQVTSLGPKSSFYFRVNPGKHRLRIGAKNEWIVQVVANAKKR